ncbi:MAG: glycosyltransferase [Hyphomicrobium sp.]
MTNIISKRKKILIACQGTRGDVQPNLAIAEGLRKAGYEPFFAVSNVYKNWIENAGFECRKLGTDTQKWMAENSQKTSSSIFSTLLNINYLVKEVFRGQFHDLLEASRDAEGILFGVLVHGACDVAEKLKIPAAGLFIYPVTPTSKFPCPLVPIETLGPTLNKLSSNLALETRFLLRNEITRWRRDILKIAPQPQTWRSFTIDGKAVQNIYGFSQHLISKPSDWFENDHITGFWFYESALSAQPEKEAAKKVEDFIRAGTKPIFIGFGSMTVPKPDEKVSILKSALRRLGLRAIIAHGWAHLRLGNEESDQFLPIGEMPHSWLFDKVKAVVHHGGIGTTATGLRAGLPSLICPLGFDQAFWGYRVAQLGAGPRPAPVKNWSVEGLEASLKDLTQNPHYPVNAEKIKFSMQQEDGVGNAVELIEKIF